MPYKFRVYHNLLWNSHESFIFEDTITLTLSVTFSTIAHKAQVNFPLSGAKDTP